MQRRKARSVALQVLFARDFHQDKLNDLVEQLLEQNNISREHTSFVRCLVEGVASRWKDLDLCISSLSTAWKIDRISLVDKNILRLAMFELMYMEETPVAVCVNEAVELARKFGTDDSPKFVNGILGSFVKKNVKRSSSGEKSSYHEKA